jgi:hypothetical protein
MQGSKLKEEILMLLKEDEMFRYAVLGLLGYDVILKRLEEHDKKFIEILHRLEEHDKNFAKIFERLEEHDKKFIEILKRLDRLDENFVKIFERLEEHDKKFDAMLEEIKRIWIGITKLREDVGRLSRKYGFVLEDIAITKLPILLAREGIIIDRADIKVRYPIMVDKEEVEVDIYVEGKVNGKTVKIIGEVKGRINQNDVIRFYNKFKKYDAIKFIFGHTIRPSAEIKARELGIKLYATYS